MKINWRDSAWTIGGGLVMFVIMAVVFHFRTDQGPAEEIAFKSKRIQLVKSMSVSLAASSEAEKSAVLASSDEESRTFADQSRAEAAKVEAARLELERLLEKGGTSREKEESAKFSQAFGDLKRIDEDLLKLAVANTNLKAYALTYGSAADAIKSVDGALSRFLAEKAGSPPATAQEDKKAMKLAAGAQSAVLRIQALFPPHIAEQSDAKMDALEALMDEQDREIRKDLEDLRKAGDTADLKEAATSYAKLTGIKVQILQLSRENTNVKSLEMSLNEKRKAMFVCQDALAALEQSLQAEPLRYKEPESPR